MMQDVLDRFPRRRERRISDFAAQRRAETADVRFESFARLEQMGKVPNPDHYEVVYFANTPAYFYGMSNAEGIGRTVPHVQFEASR